MNFADLIRPQSKLLVRLGKYLIAVSDIESGMEFKNRVFCEVRERGKLITTRDGNNIWTLTGKEFTLMSMSYGGLSESTAYANYARRDKIAYIGVGVGATPEVPAINSLVAPIPYREGLFLAPLDQPPAYPMSPSHVAIAFHRYYSETELSFGENPLPRIQEFGLFTDGSPDAVSPALPWDPGTRPLGIESAAMQAPIAYKAIEPFPKNSGFTLEITWEIRL